MSVPSDWRRHSVKFNKVRSQHQICHIITSYSAYGVSCRIVALNAKCPFSSTVKRCGKSSTSMLPKLCAAARRYAAPPHQYIVPHRKLTNAQDIPDRKNTFFRGRTRITLPENLLYLTHTCSVHAKGQLNQLFVYSCGDTPCVLLHTVTYARFAVRDCTLRYDLRCLTAAAKTRECSANGSPMDKLQLHLHFGRCMCLAISVWLNGYAKHSRIFRTRPFSFQLFCAKGTLFEKKAAKRPITVAVAEEPLFWRSLLTAAAVGVLGLRLPRGSPELRNSAAVG